MKEYGLQRFHEAQKDTYDRALKELQNGRKETHWMWFIFPQLKGLGQTEYSLYYGINGKEEAVAYLEDPVLKQRLITLCEALLQLETKNPSDIFSRIDTVKLRSCMTLFDAVGEEEIFQKVPDRYYDGKKDKKTLRMLGLIQQEE
ncbi:MAG: DUF1810 domain-containing protein [Erysipelotrichaceae bacterium]|nr:DUF1810 domain-containing protein [Erysipelotrichaceae bacterium]